MKRSANELQVMVFKAARGAGVPLGLAECLAAATPWMVEEFDALPSVLIATHHVRLPEYAGNLIRFNDARAIIDGPAAIDLLWADRSATVILENLDAPGILAALIQSHEYATETAVTFGGNGDAFKLTAASDATPKRVKRPKGPVFVSPDIWAQLADLAAKTYVPASETSRVSGAGAGLSDND